MIYVDRGKMDPYTNLSANFALLLTDSKNYSLLHSLPFVTLKIWPLDCEALILEKQYKYVFVGIDLQRFSQLFTFGTSSENRQLCSYLDYRIDMAPNVLQAFTLHLNENI